MMDQSTVVCVCPLMDPGSNSVYVAVAAGGEAISVSLLLIVLTPPTIIHIEPEIIVIGETTVFTVILSDMMDISGSLLISSFGGKTGIISFDPLNSKNNKTNIFQISVQGLSAQDLILNPSILSLSVFNTPFYAISIATRGPLYIQKVYPLTGFASQATGNLAEICFDEILRDFTCDVSSVIAVLYFTCRAHVFFVLISWPSFLYITSLASFLPFRVSSPSFSRLFPVFSIFFTIISLASCLSPPQVSS